MASLSTDGALEKFRAEVGAMVSKRVRVKSYWVGASKKGKSWVSKDSGKKVAKIRWAKGYPTSKKKANCAALYKK